MAYSLLYIVVYSTGGHGPCIGGRRVQLCLFATNVSGSLVTAAGLPSLIRTIKGQDSPSSVY